uniref:sensor histidine kinase n=1 Tax=Agathobacter sp. TaxID=2021311 RepID=UPI0040567C19
MKIKSKLIISFCIILFVPIVLACLISWSFLNIQVKLIQQTYGIKDADIYSLTNMVQLLNRYTIEDFEKMIDVAENTPQELENMQYLEVLDKALKEKHSYLVVRKGNSILYNGGENNARIIRSLPEFEVENQEASGGTYIDSEDEVIVKHVEFVFPDRLKGSAFIITSTNEMVPEVKTLAVDIVISVLLILVLTASMLLIWIYRSMITPLKKLQLAAENIKEGNLDFKLEVEAERGDEISALCVSFEDMRRRLKENAEEKITTESENKTLISNIAHDLKTPITAVKGYAEGIIDGVANTPEKIDKYVRIIYNKANEMDTLINELTLYSKIDTNRIPYNFAKINVAEYFTDCIEEVGIDLESKNIGLAYYNYIEDDILIIADPEQLRRVINNIVGNSVKYMNKPKGFINIRIKDVGDFIQVEIEDNGRGIPAKDLPYIFDRFYRGDASRNSSTGGSGIGLSIVKKIVEDHGGKIWATSKAETGTIMYFVIRKYQEVVNE